MNPLQSSKSFLLAWPLMVLGAAATPAHGQQSGLSFLHGDWAVTCDNTLTCRMEGYSAEEDGDLSKGRGGVLITRAAGPNAPLRAVVTLADYDDATEPQWPAVVLLSVDGKAEGTLNYAGGSGNYPLTQAQALVVLAGAKDDKTIEFKGGNKSFVLSGQGVSAVMLKMDDVQGRVGTPGALIRKGNKPETGVRAPVPMPVIQAAKVIGNPVSRELTASEAQAIEPMLWKAKGEKCGLHEPDRKKESGEQKFTLTPVDDQHALISTPCEMGAYQGTVAYWLTDQQGGKVTRFLLEDIDAGYESGVITTTGKGRGLGDCWGGGTWVWDGTDFRRSGEWSTGQCRLIHAGGAWSGENRILVYVTRVIPAK